MGIFFNKKDITGIYIKKSDDPNAIIRVISKVYRGTQLLWTSLKESLSCFGSGKWVNEKSWFNEDSWKN